MSHPLSGLQCMTAKERRWHCNGHSNNFQQENCTWHCTSKLWLHRHIDGVHVGEYLQDFWLWLKEACFIFSVGLFLPFWEWFISIHPIQKETLQQVWSCSTSPSHEAPETSYRRTTPLHTFSPAPEQHEEMPVSAPCRGAHGYIVSGPMWAWLFQQEQ